MTDKLETYRAFDPWKAPLRELSEMAREMETHRIRALASSDDRRRFADHIRAVLQTRAVLEASQAQRRQTRWLVLGTWALVLATIGLVVFG